MVFIHYIRILSSVTMPTSDVLLRHFRKMLLYTQGYAVAYSHLLSTLVLTKQTASINEVKILIVSGTLRWRVSHHLHMLYEYHYNVMNNLLVSCATF